MGSHRHTRTRGRLTARAALSDRRRDAPRQQTAAAERRGYLGAAILGLCLLNLLDVDVEYSSDARGVPRMGRRSLLSTLYLSGPSTLMPWAQHHLVGVADRPDPGSETALFWHIPKSGGTTAKRLYQCVGQTLAHRVGANPIYGHDQDSELVVFEPHKDKDWKVVNVDTTIKPGIIRAKQLGLVQSHTTDLIFTMEPNFAGQMLYDEEHRGRFLALFRHPVDRALSMFFYLQTATWERTYRPEWANMTVLEWARLPNAEEDYMVHKLVGKSFGDAVDEADLIIAKELVRQRFIVGLMHEMNESIRRFNIVLGVDEKAERSKNCMKEFGLIDELEETKPLDMEGGEQNAEQGMTLATIDKKNSNKHPKFEEGSPEFEEVASRNRLDMLLYKYVESLFDAQKEIIDAYPTEEERGEDPQYDRQELSRLALLPPGSAVEFLTDEERRDEPQDDPQAKLFTSEEISQEDSSEQALSPSGSGFEFVDDPRGILSNMADVNRPIEGRDTETPFFWHVPKSGGTTLQRLYWCMGSTVASEVGVNPKFGQYQGEHSKVVSFNPWKDNPGKVINVDVCSHEGILEAKSRGFLQGGEGQPHVDFVSSSEFQFATANLFSPDHMARMFALFRHPIDRAVSKFFYLQKATWEPTYNTRWAKMTLGEWASRDRGDNNWLVRNLVGRDQLSDLTNDDLEMAKEIVSKKFVVGLVDKFEESVRRFNLLLGIDEGDARNQECIRELSSNDGDSHAVRNTEQIIKKNQWNSYGHPTVERGSPEWVSLAKIHMYDNLLYRHIAELFAEQRAMFDTTVAVN